MKASSAWARIGRPAALLLVGALSLQLYFVLRIACMSVLAPQSSSFQRSEAWRLLVDKQFIAWRQQWVDGDRISVQLKRAVIASEDAGFASHHGVDWESIEKAWDRNQRAQARVERQGPDPRAGAAPPPRQARLVGGSTISQQLAKNLFLSGERTAWRKGQEFVLTLALEALLSKRRILEIYLNSVEWGEGVFGAQAAARHYFRIDAAQLDAAQSARLAVMLPAPKRFERLPASAYVAERAATIAARMPGVELP
jgi:monofunctional glycosyltransferase